jgi:hypothetical protein
MRKSKLLWLAPILAAAVYVGEAPSVAEAQSAVDINTPFTGQRPFQLDVHAGFTWYGVGLATGARFGIPILNNGFIPTLNNSVYINFGFDFYYVRCGCRDDNYYGFGFGIPVALHWEFYFNENWSAFAEVGFQIFFHPRYIDGQPYDPYDAGYWFLVAVGGSFHVTDFFLITVRLGNPYVAGGITFQF